MDTELRNLERAGRSDSTKRLEYLEACFRSGQYERLLGGRGTFPIVSEAEFNTLAKGLVNYHPSTFLSVHEENFDSDKDLNVLGLWVGAPSLSNGRCCPPCNLEATDNLKFRSHLTREGTKTLLEELSVDYSPAYFHKDSEFSVYGFTETFKDPLDVKQFMASLESVQQRTSLTHFTVHQPYEDEGLSFRLWSARPKIPERSCHPDGSLNRDVCLLTTVGGNAEQEKEVAKRLGVTFLEKTPAGDYCSGTRVYSLDEKGKT